MISFYGVFLLTLQLEMKKYFLPVSQGYSEPCQTSEIELFQKIVNGCQPLAILAEPSILDAFTGF